MSLPILNAFNIGRLITSTEIMKNYFLVVILGGSRKKIAKKMIPRVETNRNV